MAFEILKYESGNPSVKSGGQAKAEAQSNLIANLAKQFSKNMHKSDRVRILESQKAAQADALQGAIDPQRVENDAAYSATALRNTLTETNNGLKAELDNPASEHSNMDPAEYKKFLQTESSKFYKENSKTPHAETNAEVFGAFTYKNQAHLIAKQAKQYKENMKTKQATAAVTALSAMPPGEGDAFNLNTTAFIEQSLPDDRFTTEERRNHILGAARGAAGAGDRRMLDYAIEFYDAGVLNPVKVAQAEGAYQDHKRKSEDAAWLEAYAMRQKAAEDGEYLTYEQDIRDVETVRRFGKAQIEGWKRGSRQAHVDVQNYQDGISDFMAGKPLSQYTPKDRQKVYYDAKRMIIEKSQGDTMTAMREFASLMGRQGDIDKELKKDINARMMSPVYTVAEVKDPAFQEALVMVDNLNKVLSPSQMVKQIGEDAWNRSVMWNDMMLQAGGDPESALEAFVERQNYLKDQASLPAGSGGGSAKGVYLDNDAIKDWAEQVNLGKLDTSDPNARSGFGITFANAADGIYTGATEAGIRAKSTVLIQGGMRPELAMEQAAKLQATQTKYLGNEMVYTGGASMNGRFGLGEGYKDDEYIDAYEHYFESRGIEDMKDYHARVAGNRVFLKNPDGTAVEGFPGVDMAVIGAAWEVKQQEEERLKREDTMQEQIRSMERSNRKFESYLMQDSRGDEGLPFLPDGTTVTDYKAMSEEERMIARRQFYSNKTAWIRAAVAPIKKWHEGLEGHKKDKYSDLQFAGFMRDAEKYMNPQADGKQASYDASFKPAAKTVNYDITNVKAWKKDAPKGDVALKENPINMQGIEMNATEQMLHEDEGAVGVPYVDSTGNLTIGIGHNLEGNPLDAEEIKKFGKNRNWHDKPMTADEALWLKRRDMKEAEAKARKTWGKGLDNLTETQKGVVLSMYFQLRNPDGFKGFRKAMLSNPPKIDEAIGHMIYHNGKDGKYTDWYKQTPDRVDKHIARLKG